MSFRSTIESTLGAVELQQIDAICDRFEAEWRAGRRPDLASYLSSAAGGTPDCAVSRPHHARAGVSLPEW